MLKIHGGSEGGCAEMEADGPLRFCSTSYRNECD